MTHSYMIWIGLESYGMRKDSLVSSDIINGETCDKMKIYKIKWLTAIEFLLYKCWIYVNLAQ